MRLCPLYSSLPHYEKIWMLDELQSNCSAWNLFCFFWGFQRHQMFFLEIFCELCSSTREIQSKLAKLAGETDESVKLSRILSLMKFSNRGVSDSRYFQNARVIDIFKGVDITGKLVEKFQRQSNDQFLQKKGGRIFGETVKHFLE